MSSVTPEQTNEAGGTQGAAQNLGASLGTALVGAVLIAGLSAGFAERVENNTELSEDVRAQVAAATVDGIDVVPVTDVEQIATDAGLSSADAQQLEQDYADAQVRALKQALLVVALLAAAGFWPARRLPAAASASGRDGHEHQEQPEHPDPGREDADEHAHPQA
jgi:hypothetical protein